MGSLVYILEYLHRDEGSTLYLSFESLISALLSRAWTLASCGNGLKVIVASCGGFCEFSTQISDVRARAGYSPRFRAQTYLAYQNAIRGS